MRSGAQRRLELADAGDEELHLLVRGPDTGGGVEKQIGLLDRGQAADEGDNSRLGGDRQAVARRAPGRGIDGGKRLEIEPERHDANTVGAADAVPLDEIATDAWRDGKDGVGTAGKKAFGGRECVFAERAEIAFEHVTVIGVHHPGAARPGGVVEDGGEASEAARLGHVRVDDRRAEAPQPAGDLRQRRSVGGGRDLTVERRQIRGLEPVIGRNEIAHVALALSDPSVDQERVISARFEPLAETDRLNRRAADVQARDDACHADRRGRASG